MNKEEIKNISVWRNPLLSLWTLGRVTVSAVHGLVQYVLANKLQVGLCALALAAFSQFMQTPPAGMESARDMISEHGSFAIYWLVLGILSSVGLGSGLHTFVLYLGPHILRVASTAMAHETTDFSARIVSYFTWPNDWTDTQAVVESFTPRYDEDAWTPTEGSGADAAAIAARVEPTFLALIAKVALPAFLWGAGTALGELPPYFVARAAKKAGEALEELEEVTGSATGKDAGAAAAAPAPPASLVDRAKQVVFASVQRYGFIAIFLAASIPNPLFDLAGLTCGHFGIPFLTFFAATFLGKAIVKVGLQTVAIITAVKFGPQLLKVFASFAESLQEGSRLKRVLSVVEGALVKQQTGACKSQSLAECNVCCDRTFAGYTGEALPNCRAFCDATASGAASGSGGQPDDESLAKRLFGYFVFGMIAYFVLSMVTSLVQERLVHDAVVAAEAKEEAAAAPAAGHGHSHHQHATHVHGAKVISALVNADELRAHSSASEEEQHRKEAAPAAPAAAAVPATPAAPSSPKRGTSSSASSRRSSPAASSSAARGAATGRKLSASPSRAKAAASKSAAKAAKH